MNYNPKPIIAFVLILFVVLIFGGALLAQDRSKPLDPKVERMNLSVPEIKLTTVLDSSFVKAKINRTQAVIDSLELQQVFYRAERKYWLETIKIMRKEK